MDPFEYERVVAAALRAEGWDARVIPPPDGGVDVVGIKGERRLAVQAKMYGDSHRQVNADAVFNLFGAGTSHGCNEFMIATNGGVLPSATDAAQTLGVEIRVFAAVSDAGLLAANESLWRIWRSLLSLEGQVLTRPDGTTNQIVKVDGGGVTRITSNGKTQRIDIEIFKWVIARLEAGHPVTRAEINQQYPKRASSRILLILGALPMIETVAGGKQKTLRLRRANP